MEDSCYNITKYIGEMKDMCKKNIIYSLLSIFIIFLIITIPTNTYAGMTTYDSDLGDLNDYGKTATSDSQRLIDMTESVLGIIQVVGTVLSVVIIMIMGVKYMLGSIEEKAEYKKDFVPYIFGAIFLFTGSWIPQIIYKLAQNFI